MAEPIHPLIKGKSQAVATPKLLGLMKPTMQYHHHVPANFQKLYVPSVYPYNVVHSSSTNRGLHMNMGLTRKAKHKRRVCIKGQHAKSEMRTHRRAKSCKSYIKKNNTGQSPKTTKTVIIGHKTRISNIAAGHAIKPKSVHGQKSNINAYKKSNQKHPRKKLRHSKPSKNINPKVPPHYQRKYGTHGENIMEMPDHIIGVVQ